MICEIRAWRLDDAEALARLLNNKKILDNLRDAPKAAKCVLTDKPFISAFNSKE